MAELMKWTREHDLTEYKIEDGGLQLNDSGLISDISDALMQMYGSQVKITIRRIKH